MKPWLYLSTGDVDGQLTAPSSPTCPGNVFTFDCTVMPMSGMNAITLWRVNGNRDLCILSQISTNSDDCGQNNAFTASPVRANATFFLTTLSGTADPELDGILVECFGPDNSVNMDNRVGERPIQIVGQWKSFYCIFWYWHSIWYTSLYLTNFMCICCKAQYVDANWCHGWGYTAHAGWKGYFASQLS